MMPAMVAASSRFNSWTCLAKYSSDAASTPYVPWPQYIWLQYIAKISGLVYRFSIWIVSSASRIFRSSPFSSVRKSFLASCMVSVLAP